MTDFFKTIELWGETVPFRIPEDAEQKEHFTEDKGDGINRLTDVSQPSMTWFPASGREPHPAVLVCPSNRYAPKELLSFSDDQVSYGMERIAHYMETDRLTENGVGGCFDVSRNNTWGFLYPGRVVSPSRFPDSPKQILLQSHIQTVFPLPFPPALPSNRANLKAFS